MKKGAKGARFAGYQIGRNFVEVNPAEVEVTVFREKNNKPVERYRAGGKFIDKDAAEKIQKLRAYKVAQKEKSDRLLLEIEDYQVLTEGVPFFEIYRTFKKAFTDIFGFKELVIKDKKGVRKIKNINRAFHEIAAKGYQAAAIVKSKKKKSKAYDAIMNIPIEMDENRLGYYFIEFDF